MHEEGIGAKSLHNKQNLSYHRSVDSLLSSDWIVRESFVAVAAALNEKLS